MKAGFLVDTNVISEFERSIPNEAVLRWSTNVAPDQLYLSVISLGEVRRGILKLARGSRKHSLENWFVEMRADFGNRILEIDQGVALAWSEMTVRLEKAGRPIPMLDGLLAATALHHNLEIVTRNTRDFEGTGVPVLNPWKS